MSDSLSGLLQAIGIGSDTAAAIAPVAVDTLGGAGIGAAGAAITGGDPGVGAATGAGAGFGAGIGGENFGVVGSGLGGAAGGALGSLVSGGSPVAGLLSGGVGGALRGLSAGESFTGAPASGGGGTGAGGAAGGNPVGIDPATGQADPTIDAVASAPGGGSSPSDTVPAQAQQDFPNATGGGQKSVLDRIFGSGGGADNGKGFLANNQNWLLPAAGIALTAGKQALAGPSSAEKALSSDAATASGIGQQLLQNGLNGTLPAGEQQYFTRLAQQKKAAIRSQFANQGLSGSSMETTALSDVDSQIAGQIAQYSQNLLTAGGSLLGTSGSDLSKLVQSAATEDQGYSQAIGMLLSGLGGSQGRRAGVDPNATQETN